MKMPPSGYMVYVLIDPRDTAPFYVGMTCRPLQRWNQHCSDLASGAHLRVAELRQLGLKCRVRIAALDLLLAEARDRERQLISLHKDTIMNWRAANSREAARLRMTRTPPTPRSPSPCPTRRQSAAPLAQQIP